MKTLAAALAHDRLAIAQGLAEPMGQWEKYRNDFAQLGAEGFARRETLGLVEYLVNHFRTQKAVWWDLYVGERLKQCHLPVMTQQQVLERRRTVFAVDCQYLSRLLSERASADEIERLKELYTQAIAAV